MQLINWKILILLISCILKSSNCFDLYTIGSIGVGIGSYVYKNSVCRFKECCSKDEIPADFLGLQRILDKKVFGQHIALSVIVSALKAHWSKEFSPQKPLTLSLHGWPGGGKNYVTNFIKNSLYAKGAESQHIHHFIGRLHFPLKEKSYEYKTNLYQWIKGNVSNCPRQLFIFDEVEKMPPSVLNGIKPVLDYNPNVERVDYRKSVFIFISNTGGTLITDKFLELWKKGTIRKDIELKDFESLITRGAFNEEGGFHHSDTIKSNLIDHYIPFLPLQEEEVRLCIIQEFQARGVNPNENDIKYIMDYVEWGPQPDNLFSKTGCKRISQKVATLIMKKQMGDFN